MKKLFLILFISFQGIPCFAQSDRVTDSIFRQPTVLDTLFKYSTLIIEGTTNSESQITKRGTNNLSYSETRIYVASYYSNVPHNNLLAKSIIGTGRFYYYINGSNDGEPYLFFKKGTGYIFFLTNCDYDSTKYRILHYFSHEANTWNTTMGAIKKSAIQNKWHGWKGEDRTFVNVFKNECIVEKNLVDPIDNSYHIKSRQIYKIPKGINPTSGIAFGSWNWLGYHYKTITEYYDLKNKFIARLTGTYYCIKENVQDKHPKYYLRTDSVSFISNNIVSKVEEINSSSAYGKKGIKADVFGIDNSERAVSKKPLIIYIKDKMSKKQKAKFLPTA